MNGLGRLPSGPAPVLVVPGDIHDSCPVAAATGFLNARTSLKGHLKVLPVFGPAPSDRWRTTTTGSMSVVYNWRYRRPDAVAARLGGRGRLIVIEADNLAALEGLEARYGRMPIGTARSVSSTGKLRVWLRDAGEPTPSRMDLAPGCRLLATGSWVKLPPAGSWVRGAAPNDPGIDYQPIPARLLAHAFGEPIPTIRRF